MMSVHTLKMMDGTKRQCKFTGRNHRHTDWSISPVQDFRISYNRTISRDINGIPKSGLVPGPFIKFISEED